MTWLENIYRVGLEASGHRVLAPGESVPLPDAILAVRKAGYTIIKTKAPELPAIGSCWTPMRSAAAPRWVRSVGQIDMTYSLAQDGASIPIDLASWHKWVRKTRAKVAA